MGKKKNYESPLIKRTQVETESGFCAASIIEVPKDKGVNIQGHERGEFVEVGNTWGDDWEN